MKRFVVLAAIQLCSAVTAPAAIVLSIDKPTVGPGDQFEIQMSGGTPGEVVALLLSTSLGPTPYPKVGQLDIGFPLVIFLPPPINPLGNIHLPCDVPCVELTTTPFTTYYQAISFDVSLSYFPATGLSNVMTVTYDPVTFMDCNDNGSHDRCDIRDGISPDVNLDGVPDECVDCNNDGVPDGPNVSGRVWHDLACNGIEDAADPGVAAVIVTAYDNQDNLIGGTMTAADGTYVLAGVADRNGIRIEFTDYPSWLVVAPSAKGTGEAVQFIAGQDCDADLALIAPAELCPEGTFACLGMPCYINGDPLGGGTAGPLDALVRVPYNALGSGANTYLADAVQIGATWGVAYRRSTDTMYTAAFLKRHCGFGPGGIGAIYAVEQACKGAPAPANVSVWLDVGTLPGVSVGSVVRPDLSPDFNGPSVDADAYGKVGKVGLGGLAIAEDERTLYVVNLFGREVLAIDIETQALIARHDAVAGITCNNGEARPFAVSYFRGALYVGVVCTAENSGTSFDLAAYIRRLDNGVFVDVLTFPLSYPRGETYVGCPGWTGWFQWPPSNIFPPNCAFNSVVFPHPILSSIEFDNDGTMAIGFVDRFGHESGLANFNVTGTALVEGFNGGDLLRARLENNVWTLENNATAGTTTAGAGNNQGPGGGEFYFEDLWKVVSNQIAHHETSLGGVAILPGSGEVVTTAFDPLNVTTAEIRSGGVRHYDSGDGTNVGAYKVFDLNQPGTFGKAAGLGDVALLCSAVAIEIGDRVFLDQNGDGVQEAIDPGLAGVTLQLVRNGSVVATTVSAAGGRFSFLGLVANDSGYEVRIDLAQPALATLSAVLLNAGSSDLADSDGDPALVPGFVTAKLPAMAPGRTDFSIDFGFANP